MIFAKMGNSIGPCNTQTSPRTPTIYYMYGSPFTRFTSYPKSKKNYRLAHCAGTTLIKTILYIVKQNVSE